MSKINKQKTLNGLRLLIGRKGTGKTFQCIKTIQSYIRKCKRNKKPYRVFVFTGIPDEYKAFKPVFETKNISKLSNKVLVSKTIPKDICASDFKNSLVIVDMNVIKFTSFESLRGLIILARTLNIDTYIVLSSIQQISYHLYGNTLSVKLFETNDIQLISTSHIANIEIFELARTCLRFQSANPYSFVDIDLIKQKISSVDEDALLFGLIHEAKYDAARSKGIINKISYFEELIAGYKKYF